jgi:hypothetical protein
MGTLAASIVRTVVPVLIGGVLGWLATLGIDFDQATDEGIVRAAETLITALVTIAYYVLVRIIEQRFPQLGILLGLPKAPVSYAHASTVPGEVLPAADEADATPPPPGYTPRH